MKMSDYQVTNRILLAIQNHHIHHPNEFCYNE